MHLVDSNEYRSTKDVAESTQSFRQMKPLKLHFQDQKYDVNTRTFQGEIEMPDSISGLGAPCKFIYSITFSSDLKKSVPGSFIITKQ